MSYPMQNKDQKKVDTKFLDGQLTVLTQMRSNGEKTGDWVILAWHWNKSITWRWSLVLLRKPLRLKFYKQNNMWWE